MVLGNEMRESAVRLTILAALHNVSVRRETVLKPTARTTPPPSYYK